MQYNGIACTTSFLFNIRDYSYLLIGHLLKESIDCAYQGIFFNLVYFTKISLIHLQLMKGKEVIQTAIDILNTKLTSVLK